jgi:hypothetical protein
VLRARPTGIAVPRQAAMEAVKAAALIAAPRTDQARAPSAPASPVLAAASRALVTSALPAKAVALVATAARQAATEHPTVIGPRAPTLQPAGLSARTATGSQPVLSVAKAVPIRPALRAPKAAALMAPVRKPRVRTLHAHLKAAHPKHAARIQLARMKRANRTRVVLLATASQVEAIAHFARLALWRLGVTAVPSAATARRARTAIAAKAVRLATLAALPVAEAPSQAAAVRTIAAPIVPGTGPSKDLQVRITQPEFTVLTRGGPLQAAPLIAMWSGTCVANAILFRFDTGGHTACSCRTSLRFRFVHSDECNNL